tara:strand:+ start:189 stop:491 length:303 start_codon:yes stop_codon:yes gene_type:complete
MNDKILNKIQDQINSIKEDINSKEKIIKNHLRIINANKKKKTKVDAELVKDKEILESLIRELSNEEYKEWCKYMEIWRYLPREEREKEYKKTVKKWLKQL